MSKIFQFYNLKRKIEKIVGEEDSNKVIHPTESIDNPKSAIEKAELAKKFMDRMDNCFDEETRKKVRQSCSCNVTKHQKAVINELKEQYSQVEDLIINFSEAISPGYVIKQGNSLEISFGGGECYCRMFNKVDSFKLESNTWCECCNGNVKKVYELLLDREVEPEIVETIITGGNDCIFRIDLYS